MPKDGYPDEKRTKAEAMEVEGERTESEDESEVESSEEGEFESVGVVLDPDDPDMEEEVLGFLSEPEMEVEEASQNKKRSRAVLDESIAKLEGKAEVGSGTAITTCAAADECKVTDVHVVGRPARSHGSSMGDHTTPFSIVQAIVSDAVSGSGVSDAVSGLQKLYDDSKTFPGYGCEWIDPNQQERFKKEEAAFQKALAQVQSSTSCACKLANLQMAIGRFLEYREMIPLSTLNVRAVSAAGGKGKGESRSLKQYKACVAGGEYPGNQAYQWFDQAAVALWATEGAGPGQGREQIGPWQKPAKLGVVDAEGKPVRDPITQEDFFEQHCKTLPVLKAESHPKSATMAQVLEQQMQQVLDGQVAAIVAGTTRAAARYGDANGTLDDKRAALDAIRYAYHSQREAKDASELVSAVKPLLTGLSEAKKKFEDSLPETGRTDVQISELKRLTAAHTKWQELLNTVTAKEKTCKDLLSKVEAAATRAATAAVNRSRNPKPNPEDLKEEQRRLAYKEGLPKAANQAGAAQDDKADEDLNALEEAENPFGDSTIGIQLGKKDPALQPLLSGLAVQASLKDCLAVNDLRFGGRPMSPFSGTMGSHHIAWVLMCDAVRTKIVGKKLGTAEMCEAIDELSSFPDQFRSVFKPTRAIITTADQRVEAEGAAAKEDKLLEALQQYSGSAAGKKARIDSAKTSESDQKKALKDLAKQAQSCKSVEGLQLFLSTLMSLINLVPGVSANETMPDGRAEGTARQLLRRYESLASYGRALRKKREAAKGSDREKIGRLLERNQRERNAISADDLADAVKKLVDPKANEGARKQINTMAVEFVQSAYPMAHEKCEAKLEVWVKQTR